MWSMEVRHLVAAGTVLVAPDLNPLRTRRFSLLPKARLHLSERTGGRSCWSGASSASSSVCAEAAEFLSHRRLFVSVCLFYFGLSQEPLLASWKGCGRASLPLPQPDCENEHAKGRTGRL